MGVVLSVMVGALYAASIYLLLRRSLVKILIGLASLSYGANLLIFVAGRLVRGRPPLVPEGQRSVPAPYADPLPQALILTAIVISFAVLAFAMVLFRRTFEETGTHDVDDLVETDR